METLRCIATFRARRDRRPTDYLVVREHENGCGDDLNTHLQLATGRFTSRLRQPKVKTYRTRAAAERACERLPEAVPNFPGATARYTVVTALEWDQRIGATDQGMGGVPIVARYADGDIDLTTGQAYAA